LPNNEYDIEKSKCSYDNCKVAGALSTECIKCWGRIDMVNFDEWPANQSYTKGQVLGRYMNQPFRLDPYTKECNLVCAYGYRNFESNKSVFGQRCVTTNCKRLIIYDTNAVDDFESLSDFKYFNFVEGKTKPLDEWPN
jgi:hypothetical protein